MATDPHDPEKPALSARGCRNVIVIVIALAVLGEAWTVRAWHSTSVPWFFVSLVGSSSSFVLFVVAMGLVVNRWAVLDWFVVRKPPVIEHPVLGTLRYGGMRWRTESAVVRCGMAGRRRGPDPDLVEALAHAVANLPAFEARAREFARTVVPEGETIGDLSWIEALRGSPSRVAEVYFHLAQAGGTEELVRVGFRGDEPVEAALY